MFHGKVGCVAAASACKLSGMFSKNVRPRVRSSRETITIYKKHLKMKRSMKRCLRSLRSWKFRYINSFIADWLWACPLNNVVLRDMDVPLIQPHLFPARKSHERAVCNLSYPWSTYLQKPMPNFSKVTPVIIHFLSTMDTMLNGVELHQDGWIVHQCLRQFYPRTDITLGEHNCEGFGFGGEGTAGRE